MAASSQYPPAQSDTYIKATTKYSTNHWPYYATDPTKSLTGSYEDCSWLSEYLVLTNQRFHIDLGSAKIIRKIYYENTHSFGTQTPRGVKNFTFWGSNTAGSFAELTYGTDTGWTQLTTSQSTFDEHVYSDQADPKYITITNSTAYRYYAFKFANNHGDEIFIGVRRIELQIILAPTVTTPAVSAIEEITATGNGNITDTGGENCTKRGVCWNTTGSPTVADSKSEESGSFGTGAFTASMTGLIRGEKYYVKAYAYNFGGYSYGSEVTFYTLPAVTTYAPSDIIRADPTEVTANGLINLDTTGTIATRGFKYGLTEADTWDVNSTGAFSEGVYSESVTSLTADTTYFIRAYASSTGTWATAYGSYVEFKTAYPYGANKVSIRSEAVASSGDIAAVGGKRSLTINNHLIQNQTRADIISAGYLDEYKDQKTKLIVIRPTPAPFEIGDTITRGSLLFYYAAVSALISYAPAASAEHYYSWPDRDMLIRKR